MIRPFIRYPGGKSRHVDKVLKYFSGHEEEYREPFIGGGSVFLATEEFAIEWINDFDEGIYDLWKRVKSNPDSLIHLIKLHTPILHHDKDPEKIERAIALWREIKNDVDHKLYPAGYRTLFLNKTCFNGVQTGGPTGGVSQSGQYSLASRWAADSTIHRIYLAHDRLRRTDITNLPWQEVVNKKADFAILYLDPPYLKKGKQVYQHYFTLDDHRELAEKTIASQHRFVVTIDDCPELRQIWLESGHPEECLISETWLYSMSDYRDKNREGKELFIVDEHSLNIARQKKTKYVEEFE